ncbi:hypothetical protein KI688_011858 [Linnemannia hyalina]|uniref:Uncharacterized protein n=1 Tax=Linnemannia hyalina TaxID=64524 RepID=A0A9P7XY01_9FUNG|nr:hypothetical protein KI688_011858 [Linnemannia hyalina]
MDIDDNHVTGSPTLPLRSLHLENTSFSQSSLESLLENILGFCLELDGAFCLVARLRLLKHLRIGSGENLHALKPRDLKWVTKSGHSRVSNLDRKNIMCG